MESGGMGKYGWSRWRMLVSMPATAAMNVREREKKSLSFWDRLVCTRFGLKVIVIHNSPFYFSSFIPNGLLPPLPSPVPCLLCNARHR